MSNRKLIERLRFVAATYLRAGNIHTSLLEAAAALEAMEWQPIETIPKDRTSVLIKFKNPIPNDAEYMRRWNGLVFVGSNTGVGDDGFDMGFNFAAPVGCGGWTDETIAGWMPLPSPPEGE